MWIAASVRRVVFTKRPGELFTTRELLPLGARDPIDSELKRLVRKGTIKRVARGVFMRPGGKLPTVYEIACVKAKAFGRTIFQHGSVESEDREQVPILDVGDDETTPLRLQHRTFACDGGTSSFCIGRNIIVKFHRVCMRQLKLGDSPAGKVMRKLWSLGKGMSESSLARTHCGSLLADQSRKLRQEAGMMPEWMASLFHWARPGGGSIGWLTQLTVAPSPTLLVAVSGSG